MIHLENIRKIFHSKTSDTVSLQDICLDVKDGEFVAIMGPSGSGKTTLLNILGLIDRPSEGRYILCGEDTTNMSDAERTRFRRKRLGFVFQSFNLIDELTVYENVELPLKLLNYPSNERKELVMGILRKMEISHRAENYPNEISGGQQQRVAFARAVISKPKLILADEPTGNLDSKNGLEAMQLLSEMHKAGATIVMVTHSQRDASFADRIVNLFDGRVIEPKGDLEYSSK
ncbi:MAG: ABC transporter ATP-binding protein [Bacteroidaceae bacterium]|nr:ABC transporter ATP-binding protein [Bacteroidaceae bacterium]